MKEKKIRKGNIYNPIILGIFALFVEGGRGERLFVKSSLQLRLSRTDVEMRITAH